MYGAAGALFGSTPEEAFYVKCDAETNPPEVRDLGMVVTEIGVAIVRPAEFVIFRVTQATGPRDCLGCRSVAGRYAHGSDKPASMRKQRAPGLPGYISRR